MSNCLRWIQKNLYAKIKMLKFLFSYIQDLFIIFFFLFLIEKKCLFVIPFLMWIAYVWNNFLPGNCFLELHKNNDRNKKIPWVKMKENVDLLKRKDNYWFDDLSKVNLVSSFFLYVYCRSKIWEDFCCVRHIKKIIYHLFRDDFYLYNCVPWFFWQASELRLALKCGK